MTQQQSDFLAIYALWKKKHHNYKFLIFEQKATKPNFSHSK
jgi:hypothetical protein